MAVIQVANFQPPVLSHPVVVETHVAVSYAPVVALLARRVFAHPVVAAADVPLRGATPFYQDMT